MLPKMNGTKSVIFDGEGVSNNNFRAILAHMNLMTTQVLFAVIQFFRPMNVAGKVRPVDGILS